MLCSAAVQVSAESHSLTRGAGSSLLVLAECSLFLCVLHYLLLHVEAFAAADSIHVFEGLVGGVGFLSKVQIFFLSGGNPVWITGDDLGHKEEERNRNVIIGDGIRQHCPCRTHQPKQMGKKTSKKSV